MWDKVKHIKDIILMAVAIFFLFGALVMLSIDFTGTIAFGVISLICFFFSKDLLFSYIKKSKLKKAKEEQELKLIEIEKELELKTMKAQSEIVAKKIELERKEQLAEIEKEAAHTQKIKNAIIDINLLSNGIEFEQFTVGLLKKLGYINVTSTQASNDYGIDVLAEKEGIKYAIQCKLYSQPVGNKAIQEAYSGKMYYNCHIGVVLTNNTFTRNAKQLAESNGILLWDKNKLEEFIKESNFTLSNMN